VLWFERQVVGTLMDPALDATTRAAVESYVSTTLRSMPEHLRAGVAAESIVLGASSWVEQRIGRLTWLPRAPLRSASSARLTWLPRAPLRSTSSARLTWLPRAPLRSASSARLTWLPRAPLRSASSALGDQGRLRTRVDSWKTSKVDPIRQYVRLLESLVLFAENELGP
jgi:hypothetical protein